MDQAPEPSARPSKRAPERTCIATGAEGTPETLVRFVLDPGGRVMADLAAKLPGRGAWVLATRAAVEKAAAKGLFARAFKAPAMLAEGSLADVVEAGLEARALAALGLARRAGKAVAGFDQVRGALKERRAAVLLTAVEAGGDGAGKLAGLAGGTPIIRAFSVAAQSAALGKESVTHAAVLAGPEAERLLREARRLDGFRPVLVRRAQGLETADAASDAGASD